MNLSVQDALYNWLTIKVVCDARPDDTAACETRDFFEDLLNSGHNIRVTGLSKEPPFYFIEYEGKEGRGRHRFPVELVDAMLSQIEAEPEKYQNLEED